MAISGSLTLQCAVGADIVSGTVAASNEGGIQMDVTLTSSQANKEVSLTFLGTDLTAGFLVFFSDKALTIKTNSSGSPDNTFTVAAGGFFRVTTLAADITKIYLTNGAAAAAVVKIRGLKDVTP